MRKVAIYAGSFDPVTNGHLDLIKRGVKVFDRLIVAVTSNISKKGLFTVPERLQILRESVKGLPHVTVDSFEGLLVSYASRKKARVILRGLRAVSDFEHEFQMAMMNRKLDPWLRSCI